MSTPRAPQPIFPSVAVARLLLASGASVRTRNEARSTALHVAAIPYNFSSELVALLLAAGAHLDQPNKFGDSPADLVALNRGSQVQVTPPTNTTSEKLLARRSFTAR